MSGPSNDFWASSSHLPQQDDKEQKKSHPAVLLIDTSGSVRGEWEQKDPLNTFEPATVWNQMHFVICNKLPESHFRVLFWNSINVHTDGQFFKGVKVVPYVVDKKKIALLFNMTQSGITDQCLTMPHLAFDSLPEPWLRDAEGALVPTKVYLLTDGKIWGAGLMSEAELHQKLGQSIQTFSTNHPQCSLEIITTENAFRDYKEQETLQKAAGSDVYNVITKNNLTNKITKFTSYAYNHLQGFVHIFRRNVPPGYIPYEDKMFLESKTPDFIQWMNYKIRHEARGEEELITLVQNLATTLAALTKNKPLEVKKGMIRLFSNMFQHTALDSGFVSDVLKDAIEKETQGQAQLYATYRSQLKDLYKISTSKLLTSTKEALQIADSCMTFPLSEISSILICYDKMVDQDLWMGKTKYRQAGIQLNHIPIPILPFPIDPPERKGNQTPMAEQCLRQWLRAICSNVFDVNQAGDHPIYLVLTLNMFIQLSDKLSKEMKSSWRNLALIMLAKKRANSMQTEWDYLLEGNYPVPTTGKVEQFPRLIVDCMTKFTTYENKFSEILPMTFWFALCCALQDSKLIEAQWIHCKEDVKRNFPKFQLQQMQQQLQENNNVPLFLESFCTTYPLAPNNTWSEDLVPVECKLNYSCPISLDDTSKEGGYIIVEHKSSVGETCCPQVVFSQESYDNILSQTTASLCVYCMKPIDRIQGYKKVPKQPDMPDFKQLLQFDKKKEEEVKILTLFTEKNETLTRLNDKEEKKEKQLKKDNNPGVVVFLKGSIGSGKTTLARRLAKELLKLGHFPFIEGIDQYAKVGIDFKSAKNKIKNNLTEALRRQKKCGKGEQVFVIIDTCGTQNSLKNVFGVNFTHWKSTEVWANYIPGTDSLPYLAWSCQNLMKRKSSHYPEDDYVLNPVTSGFDTCIKVFSAKAKDLFGIKNKPVTLPFENPFGVQECLNQIQTQAMIYEDSIKKFDLLTIVQQCTNLN